MAAAQLVNFGTATQADNDTRYYSIVGSLSAGATEAIREKPVRVAGAFSDFYTRVTANTASVTSVFMLRKSLADTALTISYTSDETGAKLDTDSVAFADTDEVDVRLAVPAEAGTNTLTFTVLAVVFTADADTATISGTSANVSPGTSALRWSPISGPTVALGTESLAQTKFGAAYTVSSLYAHVNANDADATTTVSSRKNTADGALTLAFAAAETGAKEDVTNSDSVVSTDLYCIQLYAPARTTGSPTFHGLSVQLVSTASEFPLVAAGTLAQAFNTTFNIGLGGSVTDATATEANSQVAPGFDHSLKNLTANVSANTIATSASTVALRVDGANVNQVISYAAAETGQKTDLDSDAVTTAHAVNYQSITPNTSGTFTLRSVSITGFEVILTLTVQDATHGHTVDVLALTQANTLAAQDAVHGHTVDGLSLTQANTLAVTDSSHGHSVDSVNLTQAHVLAIADALHAHTVDGLTLTQANQLIVFDALHGHSADNVALLQAHILAVADALHGHTVESPTLAVGFLLAVADALHGHTVDGLTISQQAQLVVQDALHIHVVDSVTLDSLAPPLFMTLAVLLTPTLDLDVTLPASLAIALTISPAEA